MGILLTTQYGEVVLSRHAVDRWRQRTERSLPELVAPHSAPPIEKGIAKNTTA
ncbi:Uncharacterised protein [Vibrio cholerae]|nr:Uncharacterised protein [Vibrio cholerae]